MTWASTSYVMPPIHNTLKRMREAGEIREVDAPLGLGKAFESAKINAGIAKAPKLPKSSETMPLVEDLSAPYPPTVQPSNIYPANPSLMSSDQAAIAEVALARYANPPKAYTQGVDRKRSLADGASAP